MTTMIVLTAMSFIGMCLAFVALWQRNTRRDFERNKVVLPLLAFSISAFATSLLLLTKHFS